MAGILAEVILIGIALGLEDLGHAVVGFDPVMHAVAHDVGVVVVAIADGHVETDGLTLALRDEGVVEIPGAARGLGVEGPLLVDERAGKGEHATEPFRVIPGHDQRGGTAGARAHRGAAFGVIGELHAVVLFDERQHLVLDVFRVEAGHVVIFLAAFVALGVTAAVGDLHHDEGWDALLGDQVIEDARRIEVRLAEAGAIVRDEERGGGARDVLGRDVDRDGALVVDVVRLNDEGLGIVRIRDAELFAGDAGVEALRGLRIDLELLNLALRHAFDGLGLRGGDIGRADEVVAVGERSLVAELHEGRRTWGIERARGWRRTRLLLGRLRGGLGLVSRSERSQRG